MTEQCQVISFHMELVGLAGASAHSSWMIIQTHAVGCERGQDHHICARISVIDHMRPSL